MATVYLTSKEIKAASKSAVKRVRLMDHPKQGEKGLGVDITATGSVTFFWRRRKGVLTFWETLGVFPAITVAAARDLAHEWNIKLGKNELDKDLKKYTLKRFWDEVFKPRKFPKLAISTKRNYSDCFKTEMPALHSKYLADISRSDIRSMFTNSGDKSESKADFSRAVLSSILNFAAERGELEAVPKFPKPFGGKKRTRWLHDEEVGDLLLLLETYEHKSFSDFFQICLYTGSRVKEVASMRWKDVLFKRGIWEMPQKGGSIAPTVMGQECAGILLERHLERQNSDEPDNPFVFPAAKSKSGHLINPNKHWKIIIKRAGLRIGEGLDKLVIHTLRHTHATWLVNGGKGLEVAGKQLSLIHI